MPIMQSPTTKDTTRRGRLTPRRAKRHDMRSRVSGRKLSRTETNQLVHLLHNYAFGLVELTSVRAQAAMTLVKKLVPDRAPTAAKPKPRKARKVVVGWMNRSE